MTFTFSILNLKFVTVPFASVAYHYPERRQYREFFIFGIRVAVWGRSA